MGVAVMPPLWRGQTGAHEAMHFLQARRLTHKQLEVLTSEEAVSSFRTEADKARSWGRSAGLENIEFTASGSRSVIASRLLRDMATLYRSQGLNRKTAASVDTLRVERLGENAEPPTHAEKAHKPLIQPSERIKNCSL